MKKIYIAIFSLNENDEEKYIFIAKNVNNTRDNNKIFKKGTKEWWKKNKIQEVWKLENM